MRFQVTPDYLENRARQTDRIDKSLLTDWPATPDAGAATPMTLETLANLHQDGERVRYGLWHQRSGLRTVAKEAVFVDARSQLQLHGTVIIQPGAYATPAQHEVFLQLRRIVGRAQSARYRAEYELSAVMEEHGGVEVPLAPPGGNDPAPWPPAESEWPAGVPPAQPSPPSAPAAPETPVGRDGVVRPAPTTQPTGGELQFAPVTAGHAAPVVGAAALIPPLTEKETFMSYDRTVDITLPRGWHQRSDPESGIVIAARPREVPPSGFMPEVVVRGMPVEADLLSWRDEAQADLSAQLPDFAIEDADSYTLGDQEVDYRRFSHSFGSTDVITEQWSWQVDGVGVTLTCSSARADYAMYGDLFEQIASTVDVGARAA